jgi:hypothetical protein
MHLLLRVVVASYRVALFYYSLNKEEEARYT